MFYSFKRGQDFSLAASDGYRMLIMSCRFTITSAYSPTVGHQPNLAVTQGYHRLDGYAHAFFKHDTVATGAIIGYRRILMHFFSNAMACQFTNHSVAETLTIVLYCSSYIADMMTGNRLFYAFIKRFFGNLQKLFDLRLNLSDTKRITTVAVISCKKRATIDRNDISIP